MKLEEVSDRIHFGYPSTEEIVPEMLEIIEKGDLGGPGILVKRNQKHGSQLCEKIQMLCVRGIYVVFHYRWKKWQYWSSDTLWEKETHSILSMCFFHGGLVPCIEFQKEPKSSDYWNEYDGSIEVDVGLSGFPITNVLKVKDIGESVHACRSFIPEWQNKRWKDEGGLKVSINKVDYQSTYIDGYSIEGIINRALNSTNRELFEVLNSLPVSTDVSRSTYSTYNVSVETFLKVFPKITVGGMTLEEFINIIRTRFGEDRWGNPNMGRRVASFKLDIGWYSRKTFLYVCRGKTFLVVLGE